MPTSARVPVDVSTPRVSTQAHTPLVLVVDADATSREEREQQLLARGVRVATARTSFEGIVKASCQMPDLIVLDESLGDMEVAETARLLTISPVTAQTPVLCLRTRRRVPIRVLSSIRRQTLS